MVNILIYSGPEVVASALKSSLNHLARILLPNYTIQPVGSAVLLTQPWTANCNILIVPALRPPSENGGLPPGITEIVNDFVEAGGEVLCLNTAARVIGGSQRLGLGVKEFAFIDRTTGTTLVPVSLPSTPSQRDETTRRVRSEGMVEVLEGIVEGSIPQFSFEGSDPSKMNRLEVLAQAMEQDGEHIAALRCQIGSGFVSFWAPGLENLAENDDQHPANRSPTSSPPASKPNSAPPFPSRLLLLRYCLERLGLKLPHPTAGPISRALPQIILSTPDKPGLVEAVMGSLGMNNFSGRPTGMPGVFEDAENTFQFYSYEEGITMLRNMRIEMPTATYPITPSSPSDSPSSTGSSESNNDTVKPIIMCPPGMVPALDDTPLFDLQRYFDLLRIVRSKEGCRRDLPGFGETMIYGQVVSSTQTMFDKNPRLLSSLPPTIPVVSLGSHQLSGRGRGANAWISPQGCLQFSLLLPKVPLSPHSPYAHSSSSSSLIPPAYIPPAKLVFIQYLFALAVVDACRTDAVIGAELGQKVRIKWPNDIYVYYGGGKAEKVKIGGILVSSMFAPGGKEADIIIGCGLDVLCRHPLFSLLRVGAPTLSTTYKDPICAASMEPILSQLTMEGTLAAILGKFEKMWQSFLASGGDFEPWLGMYQDRWLHGDQLVKLTTVNPPMMVRICGITLDHGLLRTLPEPGYGAGAGAGRYEYGAYGYGNNRANGGGFIDLQPDGNSFDLMAGLIKVKGS
ncbi:hypothetical protein GYMLUDRAFT_44476 [Collybiopsis luxurians FD-317 M1]|uniref:BPL/LPL catalytic domain-containing protein n=1 Tax=Collybiopsis luxurians FD-317 M1 TaxID=944289 RepID=A0A0D0CAQ1_9AGAR|nr:hypothetical protein GYMLUDRAFT_44476 [Collybiopsis luxurians FD-317 M1]